VDVIGENLKHLFVAIPFFLILIGALVLGKLVYAWTTPYRIDHELTENDNPAFGVHFALYLLGLIIAIGGTLYRGQFTDWTGILTVIGFSLLCIGLMRLSIFLNERFLFPEFNIYKEMIQDRNAGTGFVIGGACLATGLLINGALSVEITEDLSGHVEATGEELRTRIGEALIRTLVFYVIGQGLILASAWFYRKIAGYDVHAGIEHDDNLAAGLAYGGFLTGLGIIIRASLMGAKAALWIEIATTLLYAVIGLVLLLGAQVLADRVLLPASRLWKEVSQDKNVAAGTVVAACFVSVALAFAWVVAH